MIEAASGHEALAYLEAHPEPLPDVVFLDIEMPGIDGYETCRRMKAMDAGRTIPVIFLSGHDDLNDRLQAFDAGGAASPLEESVIDKVKEAGRIFSFKNRMVVNYDTVPLLVTDMPLDNPDFCGRIRDHAAMIAEAAQVALDNIVIRKAAIDRTREFQEAAHMTVARRRHLATIVVPCRWPPAWIWRAWSPKSRPCITASA